MGMFIGVDIGTSGTKAACFSENGTVLKACRRDYPFADLRDGRRELDPGMVFRAVKFCLQDVNCGKGAKSITVSALGEAIVPVDSSGTPLCNAIVGTDARGTDQSAWLVEKVGAERLHQITGLNISTIYSVNKILWLKENRPDLYQKIYHIFTFQDFIVYLLCGATAIDYSMASRTMLFDTNTFGWSQELLSVTGIDRNFLSDPVPPGKKIGELQKNVAAELGYSDHLDIVAGTHDHICNALGCGVFRKGWCSNTVGTTEGLTAVIDCKETFAPKISRFQIACEPFVARGLFNTVAWNNTSGALLRWFTAEFCKDFSGQCSIYDAIEAHMPQGPTGLLVLPHFSGSATPYMDPLSKGAVIGLSLGTSREQLYKALVEGANYELMLILDCLIQAGVSIDHIVASGAALSEKLLQIKADIIGKPIYTVQCRLTGPLGGAILGAVFCNEYGTIEEAVENMVHSGKVYLPIRENHQKYLEIQKTYRELYWKLKDINHNLGFICRS